MISRAAGRRLVVFGFWTLFGAISGLQIQISMLSHHHSWARVIGYQGLVRGIWIAFTFLIARLVRRVPFVPPRASAFLLHGTVALAFWLIHIAAWVTLEFLLVPYDSMNPVDFAPRFRSVALYQMPLELLLYALVVLAHLADESSVRQRQRERKEAQLSRSEAPGRIAVRSAREGDCLVIEIFNTGRLDTVRRNGIGLSITAARLAELHGDRGRLELSEHDGGVLARVTLPFREVA